jgi:hypothetical protein
MSGIAGTKTPRDTPPRRGEGEGGVRPRSSARCRSRSPGRKSRRPTSPPTRSDLAGEDHTRLSPKRGSGSPAHRSGSERSLSRRPSPLGGHRARGASRLQRSSPRTSSRELSKSPAHGRSISDGRNRTCREDIGEVGSGREPSPGKRRVGSFTPNSQQGGKRGGSSPMRALSHGLKVEGRSRDYRASPLSKSSGTLDRGLTLYDQDRKGAIPFN